MASLMIDPSCVIGLVLALTALFLFMLWLRADTVSIVTEPAEDAAADDLPSRDGEPMDVADEDLTVAFMLPLHTGSGSPVEILTAVREVQP